MTELYNIYDKSDRPHTHTPPLRDGLGQSCLNQSRLQIVAVLSLFDCEALLLTERKSIINHLLGIGKTSHATPLQLHVKRLVVEIHFC